MSRKWNLLLPSLAVLLLAHQRHFFVEGACRIREDRCSFPFEFGAQNFTECIPRTELGGRFACRIPNNDSEKEQWGVCNGGCFQEGENEAVPLSFEDLDTQEMAEFFCKTKASQCVFPFTHDETTYEKCAPPIQGRPYPWCATAVTDDGYAIDDFWGRCDMNTCVDEGVEEIVEPKKALLTFEQNGVTVNLTFEQSDEESPLRISGVISGLEPGPHGFHVHENPVEDGEQDCGLAGGHYNPFNTNHGGGVEGTARHVGDFGNIIAEWDKKAVVELVVTHASLFPTPDAERNIVGRSIVIHENEDDLGLLDDDGSRSAGNSGPRLACATIKESGGIQWNLMLIIIIAVIVLIIALVLLIICLIYCYCCKSSSKKKKGVDDLDGLPYANGDSKKVPLYDELSIPFIDASPAPTPKTGRSTERLSFFHRSSSIGKSRGSLSIPPPYAPPPPPGFAAGSQQEISWKGSGKRRHKNSKSPKTAV